MKSQGINTLVKKYLETWANKKNYELVEDDAFKQALREMDLRELESINSINILTLVLTASIHHGIKTKEIAKTVMNKIPEEKYMNAILSIIKQRSYYRRVFTRALILISGTNPVLWTKIAVGIFEGNEESSYVLATIGAGEKDIKEIINNYAESLAKDKNDNAGAKKVRSVISEFFN